MGQERAVGAACRRRPLTARAAAALNADHREVLALAALEQILTRLKHGGTYVRG